MWPGMAAAAQAAAAADRQPVSSPLGVGVYSTSQDRCAVHPGVRWYGPRPCFLCEPESWEADPPAPVQTYTQHADREPDAADVETIVREFLHNFSA